MVVAVNPKIPTTPMDEYVATALEPKGLLEREGEKELSG